MAEPSVKNYEINGKTYQQFEMVFGEIKQLAALVGAAELEALTDRKSLVAAMGDDLMRAFAIVLTEQGTSRKDKDIEAQAALFDEHLTVAQIVEVINDFFTFNPIAELLSTLVGLLNLATPLYRPTPSKTSSSSSAAETSASVTASSGAVPLDK